MIRMPQKPWEWVAYLGVITQLIVSLSILFADYSNVQSAVRRDLYVVAILALLGAVVVAILIPSVAESKAIPRIILGSTCVIIGVTALGMLAGIVAGWALIPGIILGISMLILFREMVKAR